MEVDIESEPVRVLNIETCSTKTDDEPSEADRDLARPLISEDVRLSEPARDLSTAM